ncbi:MAG: glycosyltransferase family 2 protein [Ignavibacteria bacterium]|nr:glycosyltransferase family 2 protein [Ignavibacteria bacterium]MBI3766006.1 glycosyltransferase family 2 protein [Ignavibacteriales bacterium]
MNETRQNLSVIIITHNEEQNIVECLQSVAWVDDIVVVDSQSSDRTVDLARKFTPKVLTTPWMGYAAAKNFALEKTKNEWIFWLDADERVPNELSAEIQDILKHQTESASGYEVARRAYFLGRWIKHCGWYPGYVVRLFRKDGAKFDTSRVHEKLEIRGTIGRLRNDLLHYTDDNLFHYLAKFNRYTTLAAEDLRHGGKKFSIYDIIVRPSYLFFKMYFIRLGFLDGMHGLVLSLLSAAYVFCKYAKLWDSTHAERP